MGVQETLTGCYDALRESAKIHREHDCPYLAHWCDRNADRLLEHIDDPGGYQSPAWKRAVAVLMLLTLLACNPQPPELEPLPPMAGYTYTH